MDPINISRNLVFVFSSSIVEFFNEEDVKQKISLTYEDLSGEIGSTSLGNFKSVFTLSEPNIQVVAQANKLVIADSAINNRNSVISFAMFSKFINNVLKLFVENENCVMVSFGINFTFSYAGDDTERLVNKLKTQYFKSSEDMVISAGDEMVYALPLFGFKSGNKRYTIGYVPQYGDDNQILSVFCNTNISYKPEDYPGDANSVNSLFKQSYDDLRQRLLV